MAKRKALGKGLAALIPDVDTFESGTGSFFQCPIEAIEPNPLQPRQMISSTEMEEMVRSVREQGVITPLLVTKVDTGYQLIAGERRWRAAQKAGLRRVPVVVREVTPVESLELALIENIHRKDLNPIEEAHAYKKLIEETGATQESLAKRLGKDRSSIANLLRILKLPAFIQKDVVEGTLQMGHARVLAGIDSLKEQREFRDRVIKQGLSVHQLEALVRRKRSPKPKRKSDPEVENYIRSLETEIRRKLGTKVEIKQHGKGGQIVVHFYSHEELDRLIEQLT
jgi:ParB family chromosome partitioning protein